MFGNTPSAPEPDSKFYRHPAKPEWGRGVLIAERDGKLILQWEDGAEHAVAIAFRDRLEVFELPDDEAQEVSDRVRGHRSRRIKAAERDKARAIRLKKSPPPPRATFDEQLRRFAIAYPGGFTDPKYVATERGTGGDVASSRDAATAKARDVLGAGAFGADGAYDAIQAFLAETKLLHPVEGAVRFRSLAAEHRPALLDALKGVLHGDGDYAARFDAYVAAYKFVDAQGAAVRPTWPLTTIFQALLAPADHALVKPKLLQEQALVLNLPVNYQPLPSGAVYEQLRAVLKAVEGKLKTAGLAPRDLVDVAAFVNTTLGPKAVASSKNAATTDGAEAPADGADAPAADAPAADAPA